MTAYAAVLRVVVLSYTPHMYLHQEIIIITFSSALRYH